MHYENLDQRTRIHMASEITHDVSAGRLYVSHRLNDEGKSNWAVLLSEAAESHDDSWLAGQLQTRGYLNTHEVRKKPSGGTTTAKVPLTASATLAEGEFNRFYARGLCQRAI